MRFQDRRSAPASEVNTRRLLPSALLGGRKPRGSLFVYAAPLGTALLSGIPGLHKTAVSSVHCFASLLEM